MPEVYNLPTPENFKSSNNHRSKTIIVQNDRKAEMYHLRSNEHKRTPTYDLLKPVSSPIPATTSVNTKRKLPMLAQPVHRQKAEMYHFDTRRKKTSEYNRQTSSTISIHQKPKSNGVLTQSNSPSRQKVTTYMITASNEDHFLPPIIRAPSPVIRSNQKKRLVTFDATNHNDKYAILNKQRHLSIENHSLLASSSKATDSIDRSMNMYRFKRN